MARSAAREWTTTCPMDPGWAFPAPPRSAPPTSTAALAGRRPKPARAPPCVASSRMRNARWSVETSRRSAGSRTLRSLGSTSATARSALPRMRHAPAARTHSDAPVKTSVCWPQRPAWCAPAPSPRSSATLWTILPQESRPTRAFSVSTRARSALVARTPWCARTRTTPRRTSAALSTPEPFSTAAPRHAHQSRRLVATGLASRRI
mmetsp:Transcript_28832/g.40557  ORF Transcript_28832/g.40557 Transcript_28832/m.40557 type:complete len:206 (-) Transcript_28832:846-1463(-)